MTDYTDLIARLRGPIKHPQQSVNMRFEAADALEAQARRIAELERELASTREECKAQIDDMWEQQLEAKARQTDYGEGFEEGLAVQAARIRELMAALKPFAAIADESTDNLADNYMYSDCYPMSAFRAARAAYLGEKE